MANPTRFVTIYPIGAYNLHGLVWQTDVTDVNNGKPYALCVDAYQGHLLKIDPLSEGATVLNNYTALQFRDATGLAIAGDTLWITKDNGIYYCNMVDFDLQPFMELPNRVDGIAVSEGGVYVSSSEVGKIFVFGRATRTLLRIMDAPGAGLRSCISLLLRPSCVPPFAPCFAQCWAKRWAARAAWWR